MILLDPLAHPVIAHRGASGQFPENTLLAFREALRQRADAIEFDVRLTRDRVPVVIHDDAVDRTTDGAGMVADMSLSAIRELDAGAGERVPTLSQVLEATGETPLLIELKDARAGHAVARVLQGAGAVARVLVGSFDTLPMTPVRAAGIATTASRAEVARFWLASRVGWSRFLGRYGALSVPERRGPLRVVDASFVSLATRAARPVHVWTVDDVAAAERLQSIGVAGVLTNFPGRMRGLS